MKVVSEARLRVLSNWFTNLSAGWFGAMFIAPVLTPSSALSFNQLITAFGWSIITFELAVRIESVIKP